MTNLQAILDAGGPWQQARIIGDQLLIQGDCREVMAVLPKVDAVLTDPPFSARTHAGHDAGARKGRDNSEREKLGYAALTVGDVSALAAEFCRICTGWICWITDHTLAPHIAQKLEAGGRYVFAPLPFYQAGRSVRLSGDGPCSWTDWIVPARTAAQMRWGTLPGGYIAGDGWKDKERMGGKPLALMMQMVDHYSRQGQVVLDPFLGGGTTLVAAQKMQRLGIGIEIDANAYAIACKRVQEVVNNPPLFTPAPPKPVQQGMDL
jgi:hypothetical protein